MNDDEYLTLREPGRAQTRVLGSRFWGHALYVSSETEALRALEVERKLYHDATHWCYAFRVEDNNSLLEKSSDAGEPHGTAGIPILREIQCVQVINALVIVTRWFGGTKLGTGNLARAYGECAKLALNAATIERKIRFAMLQVSCSFDDQNLVYMIAQRHHVVAKPLVSADGARLEISAPRSLIPVLTAQLTEEGRGRLNISMSDS
jgi:uncharacterized YigZ family protein